MPEFILDHGTPDAARQLKSLDSFTQGYVEAMFFTDTGTGDDAENNLQDATVAELAPSALQKIIVDCQNFQHENADELQAAYETETGYDAEKAGRDYWYTRNGHGTGFWDRGLGVHGDYLANAARYSEVSLYRGDDGLLYLA